MAILRLKPEHKVSKAVNDLFSYMEKHGLSISWNRIGEIIVQQKDYKEEFHLYDLEINWGDTCGPGISALPPELEYKILKDDGEDY